MARFGLFFLCLVRLALVTIQYPRLRTVLKPEIVSNCDAFLYPDLLLGQLVLVRIQQLQADECVEGRGVVGASAFPIPISARKYILSASPGLP